MYIYSDPIEDPIFRPNIYYGDLIMETYNYRDYVHIL